MERIAEHLHHYACARTWTRPTAGDADGSLVLNPDQAIANGLKNEGVALISEYIVAIQLGLTGGSAGHMHSDSFDSRLTQQLNQLAKSAGIDVKTVTWGFNAPEAGMSRGTYLLRPQTWG